MKPFLTFFILLSVGIQAQPKQWEEIFINAMNHEDGISINVSIEQLQFDEKSSNSGIIEIIDNNPKIKNINLFRQNEWKINQEKNTKLVLKNRKKFIGNEMKYVSEIINNAKLSCTSGSWTKLLEKDFNPITDARASKKYRMEVAKNLLEKCFLEVKQKKLIRINA